jgi:preprotein translocase subunit SecG
MKKSSFVFYIVFILFCVVLHSSANVKQKMDKMNKKVQAVNSFGQKKTGQKNNGKVFGQKKRKSNKNR